jgi:hypothetical protein
MLPLPKQDALLPIIQLSITPVILISGIGALLLSMTNRMGRIVDRTRSIAGSIPKAEAGDRQHLENQLSIMFRRAKLLRMAMTLASSSMFVSGLLIVTIFVTALFSFESAVLVFSLFITSVFLLLGGLAAFIRDVFVSLKALEAEVARVGFTREKF